MKTIKKHISLFFICSIPLTVAAQHTYTLDECIQEAFKNNIRIRNAENNQAAARHGKAEAFTHFFPSVNATGTSFMADKGLLETEIVQGKELSILKNGVVGGVTASIPIFTGGQIVNGNKLAQVNVEVSRLQRLQAENEVRLTTEQYFWQVVMLKEKLKTFTDIESQLENIHKDVEASVHAGIVSRNDLLQVQLRRNETRSGRMQIENVLFVSQRLLAQYMGHPTDSVEILFHLDQTFPERPNDLYRSPDASLCLTNEYHLLQQNVEASRLHYKVALGKNLPTLAVGGGYMYDNLLDKDHSFWVGFATVSVPLSGWWGGSHTVKKQKLQVRNTENLLADQSQLLKIRMQNTWNKLNEAYKQVEIAIESIGQASENLRIQTDYYNAGTCTMSDLLEAQTLYQRSHDQYIESYAQYEVKRREYLQSTGR